MTREEAIAYGKRAIDLGLNDETQAFCELAIKALEQKPCEDTISRADAIRVASGYCHPANIAKELAKLPPVQPKTEYSCDQIKWERDMAIAQLNELGYGLGEKPRTGHWIEYTRVLIPEPINKWEQAWYCSECGYGNQECEDGSARPEWKCCPNCMARMIEPQGSDKINCETTKCENCQNHNYCDFEPHKSEG